MNAQQEAVALFRFLESRGVKPSVRMIGRILRDEMRVKVDDHRLRVYLNKFTAVAPQSTAPAPQISSTITAPAPQATATPPRLRARDKVSLVPSLFTNPSGSADGASAAVRPRKRQRTEVDRSWVEPLRQAVAAMEDRTLASLTVDERMLLARYHCLTFGNCSASESVNRARAAPVAAGITNLASHREHGSLRVWEYISAETECWEARGKVPHFKVWDITTFLLEAHA